jgi:excisionase family DNA binding protein
VLTVTEAAARLGVTPRRVQALIQAGRLKATRFGRAWQLREATVAAFKRQPEGWPRGKSRP